MNDDEGRELSNLGAGESDLVLIEQNGPLPPPPEAIGIAHQALRGEGPLPLPCLDCRPNLVLTDHRCESCGDWEWGIAIAHDDTCPALQGIITRFND